MSNSRIAGRYELQGQLGEGGMGVVWRALDVKTGSPVAIKLMKDMSDPVAVDLFTKEWRALAEISHPNIVEVRDVDIIEENGEKKPFFVMPLLHGTTLADLIANASSRLTLERVIEIATHVCRGLQAAHQRGLVHRDLKPSNILVMDDDSAKIIDFGVVHLAGSKSITGQKGTFQYMSPEQALMREITPASDLFSMGIILYEALTGRKPFARTTVQDTIEAVLKFIPPSVSELNPNINQSVSRVIHKCLAKQPIHRFASARDLAEALQKALRNEPLFDSAKIEQRIERAKAAYKSGDEAFASEILAELEAEGHLDPRITVLRTQIEMTAKAKKIRQLLESARARIEQDEIPLALDKIREVLQLDPENSDARAMREAIEKQRSETQIAKWLELAQTHLNNRDFAAARNAAQEVLAINRADARAMDLLEKIGSTEADAKRIREQKEQLYTSALRAYQNGEISSALGKLERLFSVAQANPSAAIPERDAVYQSFYKEVRSERDSIHGALEDAQRQFREKNFAGAMAVCKDLLAKYPNDGTFQALKIRIEDAERQELSSYTAEISKRVETERDLDRRVNIVREACERYPYEAQFAQQLKLVRERRDLVNSIVVKARQYEERGQYAEAISQWDILRNIHPDYPGIAIELEQCRKKRDQQGRDEERSRLVNEIDGLVKTRSFAKAIEYSASALEEFPGDAELSGLRTLAEQGLERTKESRRLFEEGQRCGAQGDLVQATELLRSSLELDPRAPGLRDAVINVLVERARALGEDRWRDAEPLCQEAIELDANHPAVRVLCSSIADAKRKGFVVQCLTECRSLVAAANFDEAAARVRAAREVYPNDARLEQYEANLQKEINDFLRQEQKRKDQAVLTNNRRLAEQSPDRANLRAVLESSYAIRTQHPDDPEIARTISEIELAVKNAARVEDVNQVFRDEPALADADGWRATMVQQAPGQAGYRAQEKKGPQLVEKTAAATTTKSTKPAAGQESSFQVFVRQLAVRANDVQRRLVAVARPNGQWSATRLGVAGGVVVLLPIIAYLGFHWPVKAKRNVETQPTMMVTITTDPPDSTVTIEGTPIASGAVPAGSTIEVSRLGYKNKQVQIQPDSDGKVSLEPEPFHLSLHTSGGGASAQLDGQNLSDFTDGSLEYDLAPDGTVHTFTVSANGKHMFTLIVQSSPGQQPRVTGLDANDLLAIASLGNQATLYGATNLGDAHIGDLSVAINPSGAPFTVSDQNHDVVFGQGENQASASIDISNAPTLVVQSLHAEGRVLITTNADKAALTVDGSPLPRQNRGWTVSNAPGRHKFTLSADGYEPQSWTMKIQRHGIVNRKIILHAKVAAPALAGLNITGGTPGAEVALDGKKVGELDSSGNLNLPNVVALGKHSVGLSKPGLEPREFEIAVSPSAPGKPLVDAQLSKPLLSSPTGTLAFEASVKGVAIKYRRAGDAQFHEANLSEKVRLQPGQYEIEADAPGYQRFSTTVNLAKEDVTVALNMTSIPDYEFEDPTQISHEGAWVKSKAPGRYVNLKPGRLSENLVFARPGKTLFWDKKVEWFVDNPAHSARVQYSLEGQSGKLTRRLMTGQDTLYQKEAKVDAQAAGQKDSLSLHIRVEDKHIRITNDKGVVVDDFMDPARDFSGGRIGVRSDSLFLVRSNNQ